MDSSNRFSGSLAIVFADFSNCFTVVTKRSVVAKRALPSCVCLRVICGRAEMEYVGFAFLGVGTQKGLEDYLRVVNDIHK